MKQKKTIIAVVAALSAIACLVWGVRTVAAGLVRPIENGWRKAVSSLGVRIGGIFNSQATAARNKELERENALLRMVRADNDSLRSENERLRALVGFKPPGGRGKWIPASVLSVGGATGARNFLRIDRGTRAGVKAGAAVAVPEGLVGRVAEAGFNEAMVIPITDPGVRVACEIKTPDPAAGPIYGILYGSGAYSRVVVNASLVYAVNPLRLGHIGRNSNFGIPSRAKVVTSGLGGVYPRGLPVGHLLDGTSEDEMRLERQGEVVPAVDFPGLEYVFVRGDEN